MASKLILLFAVLLMFPQDSIVQPNVEKKTTQVTTENVIITRKCPDGYEGHFVDPDIGFDGFLPVTPVFQWNNGGPLVYAICFKKDFMDKVRKNPDLLTQKPIMRGA